MSGTDSDNGSKITLINEEQLNYLKQIDPKLYKKLKESLNGGLRKFKSKGGIEGKDYIKCKICGRYSYDSIIHHLRVLHNVTREQYNEEFPDSLTVPQNIRDRMSGSNNPGYQHGGRLSPWSNKSEKHSKEQIEESKRKAKLDRPNVRTLSYWESKGFSKEEAKEELGKFQTRDLDFFINKYGEELGTEKWNNKINTWQKTLNSKSDEEKQEINKKKIYKSGSISKGELNFLSEIKKRINNDIKTQLILPRKFTNRFYKYDIIINNKIIEYNGDLWHANPKLYNENDIPKFPGNKLTANEIWIRDLEKINSAKELGFDVYVVWEMDFKSNKDKLLKEVIDWINKP